MRLATGVGLLLVALFMLVGFFNGDVDASAPATLVAVLIAIGIPAAAGAALLARHFRSGRGIDERRAQLRRQTLEAEILRLAGEHGGKLTAVEVMTALAVGQDDAQHGLDALMRRGIADIEITDSGVLVYAFRDIRLAGEKPHARGILDG